MSGLLALKAIAACIVGATTPQQPEQLHCQCEQPACDRTLLEHAGGASPRCVPLHSTPRWPHCPAGFSDGAAHQQPLRMPRVAAWHFILAAHYHKRQRSQPLAGHAGATFWSWPRVAAVCRSALWARCPLASSHGACWGGSGAVVAACRWRPASRAAAQTVARH